MIISLWPTPNPLAGAQTVGIIEPAEKKLATVSQVLAGLESALSQRGLKMIHDLSQADALIYSVEIKNADFSFSPDKRTSIGRAHAVLLVSRNNQESVLDLYVMLNEQGMKAELVGRKAIEFWKK